MVVFHDTDGSETQQDQQASWDWWHLIVKMREILRVSSTRKIIQVHLLIGSKETSTWLSQEVSKGLVSGL